ncbi:WD40/YVTN/BNR-like repeat-containing protein [Phytoactinopolyspora limicola]|uniref:WD40/YVTN/BNR-like repeat-containing protein n=1 Tax=Phytoactinopolyspora limicola TaxID=2715536 RepID=UPI00140E8618|nr:hypothetical protein [Phytoactinopolyspora limicola]
MDFHALDAKHGMVYGLDSGTSELMVSDDRQSWDRLGQIAMADVTISPDDPDTVIVTTEDGAQLSVDGGGEFAVLGDAPVVMLADWARPDELDGVGPAGDVHSSVDGGQSWQEGATLGERPQAMTVAADGTVYVALEESIVVSNDGGQAFTLFYTWTAS